jgi:hypothetical protein
MRVECIDNRQFLVARRADGTRIPPTPPTTDLTVGKVYNVLAEERGFYRVVDDSGEDYLYPVRMFRPLAD